MAEHRAPESEDLTGDDNKVIRTGNGLMPEDPKDQPPQDPNWLPPGTISDTEVAAQHFLDLCGSALVRRPVRATYTTFGRSLA